MDCCRYSLCILVLQKRHCLFSVRIFCLSWTGNLWIFELEKAIESSDGVRSYIRATLSEDGKSVTPLTNQEEISTLSDASAFIAVGEKDVHLKAGDEVAVVILERRYI